VECDGEGGKLEVADESDTPADDGNDCTIEACEGLSPQSGKLAPAGTSCGEDGVCSESGTCGACVPNERQCVDGASFKECGSGGAWLPPKACESTGACVEGACLLATAVAAGGEHSCALFEGGKVSCWGSNERGQLGIGTTSLLEPRPHQLVGLEGVTELALGASHTCALLADKSVRCWGDNQRAQLGQQASVQPALSPQPVGDGLLRAEHIVAGGRHTCAVRAIENDVVCWGDNEKHQISSAGVTTFATPESVVPFSGTADVAAGDAFTCFGGMAGVYCRGENDHKQSSHLDAPTTDAPTLITDFPSPPVLSLGGKHACARHQDGALHCWGDNHHLQLGINFLVEAKWPVDSGVLVPTVASGLALGGTFSCAVDAGSSAPFCVGDNSRGQLGRGSITPLELESLPVPLPHAVDALVAGRGHACALQKNGVIACWGAGEKGQLGRGSLQDAGSPAPVAW
jgi:hypothetical protein